MQFIIKVMANKIVMGTVVNCYAQQLIGDISSSSESDSKDGILLAGGAGARLRVAVTTRIKGYVDNVVPTYGDSKFQRHFRVPTSVCEAVCCMVVRPGL